MEKVKFCAFYILDKGGGDWPPYPNLISEYTTPGRICEPFFINQNLQIPSVQEVLTHLLYNLGQDFLNIQYGLRSTFDTWEQKACIRSLNEKGADLYPTFELKNNRVYIFSPPIIIDNVKYYDSVPLKTQNSNLMSYIKTNCLFVLLVKLADLGWDQLLRGWSVSGPN